MAMAAADDLWRHTCRFTAPLEIVTNFGSQFLNQRLTYHKEESVINIINIIRYPTLSIRTVSIEWANKEVNRFV